MKRIALIIAIVLISILAFGCAPQEKPKGTEIFGKTSKGDKITVDQMAKLAPGTAVNMAEIGYRWWVLYYAGVDGNWDLASYQLEEAEEAMERISVTRPKQKEDLEAFLDTNMDPMEKAIGAKDANQFKTAFDSAIKGCNSCHKKKDKSYIHWQIPTEKPPYLQTKPVK